DVPRREAIQGPLLDLDDSGDRLRADGARTEHTLLSEFDQPAAPAAFTVQQGPFPVGSMGSANDHTVAFLEPAAPAEDDQGAGAAITIGGGTDGAFGAVHLQVLALAADHTLGLDLVGPGVLLGLPRQPLPLVVGEGLAGQHQRELRPLL